MTSPMASEGHVRLSYRHPAAVFEEEMVKNQKKLTPFVGIKNKGRRRRSTWNYSNGGGAQMPLSTLLHRGKGSEIEDRRRSSVLNRYAAEESSSVSEVQQTTRFIIPPRVVSRDVMKSSSWKRARVSSLSSVPTTVNAPSSPSRPTFLEGAAKKLPLNVLSILVQCLPDMNPAQTVDANVSCGLRDYAANQYLLAIPRLSRAIAQHPKRSFVPRFVRGLCFDNINELELALRDFNVCCGGCGTIESGLFRNVTSGKVGGGISKNLCQEKIGVIRERKRNTIASDEGEEYHRALAFFNRGVVHTKMGHHDLAINDYNHAIDLFGFDPNFYRNRALLLRRKGDFDGAQRDYQLIRRIEEGILKEHKLKDEGDGWEESGDEDNFKTIDRQDGSGGNALVVKNPSTPCSPSHQLKVKKTTKKKHRPGSSSSHGQDFKVAIYGQVHSALTCPPEERTEEQIQTLVKESKMMSAFDKLNEKQLSTLWRYLEYKKIASNVRIFEQGDPAEDYFLVWTGCVSARVRKESSDSIRRASVARALALETELKVNYMTAGETLGEAVVETRGLRKASCVTEEPTELLVLQKQHFDQTFQKFLQRAHEEKVEFLSKFDCFASWTIKKLTVLAKYCRERKYHAGEVITVQNAPVDSMYFIKTGVVSVLRTLSVNNDDNDGGSSNERSAGVQIVEQSRTSDGTECENNDIPGNKLPQAPLSSSPPSQQVPSSSREVCVARLFTGDVFGESAILDSNDDGARKCFPSTIVCETQVICYRYDRVQIIRSDFDDKSKKSLAKMAVSYPDDSILLQAHVDRVQFRKQSERILRRIRLDAASMKKKQRDW